MRSTSRPGLVRSLALMACGVLVGAALVAPVVVGAAPEGTGPAAIQTRAVSCDGLNFHPINTTTQFDYDIDKGMLLIRTDKGQQLDRDGWFYCDPGLPHRAVVTKVQFTVYDDSTIGEARYCSLIRQGLTASLANDPPQVMGEVPTTGMADEPGMVRRSSASISHATVDNVKWSYWLQCQINFPATDVTGRVGIRGASVTYRIDSANG